MRGEYSRVGAKIIDQASTRPSSNTVPLWLRIASTGSTWLALAGYTLFALTFTSQGDNVKISRAAAVSIAAILLAAGYLGAAGTFLLSRRSPSVQYNAVLLPFLLTSVGGLIEIVINHSLHKNFPVGKSSPYIYGPLIVASLTTILFGLLSFLAYWHIRKEPAPTTETDVPVWQSHAFGQGNDPRQSTELLPQNSIYSSHTRPYERYETRSGSNRPVSIDMNDMVPEDEAQRRQLLRLLLAKEEQTQRGPSPDASSTYRIDWQGEDEPRRANHTRHLSIPDGRPRAGSAPSITDRWHIHNLLGRKRPPTREGGEVEGDLPDPRETRRREIERNSLVGSRDSLGLHPSASELDITRGQRYSR